MQIYNANEAKTHFGKMLDAAQRGPVQVTRHKRVVGVMVSAEDYAQMRALLPRTLLGNHRQDFYQGRTTRSDRGKAESVA